MKENSYACVMELERSWHPTYRGGNTLKGNWLNASFTIKKETNPLAFDEQRR
jgi:hypothetical protein